MPVRSLHSPVLRWPVPQAVRRALDGWLKQVLSDHPEVLRIGYFGSYARGDWGVGSDLDLVVIVPSSDKPFTERPPDWDVTRLPVPTDTLIYTQDEWDALAQKSPRFFATLGSETVWVFDRGPGE
jgi:predicted nucleotidyltransferase